LIRRKKRGIWKSETYTTTRSVTIGAAWIIRSTTTLA